jgi:hypothetical protein
MGEISLGRRRTRGKKEGLNRKGAKDAKKDICFFKLPIQSLVS